MKKVYLLLLLCCLSFTNFAATWYANSGYADTLSYWWSNPDYTGSNPATFSNPGDTFIMNGSMTTAGVWAIGGSLVIDTGIFAPFYDISIGTIGVGGNFTMNGNALFSPADLNDLTLTLYGNLNVLDSSTWNNPPAVTHIEFANTLTNLTSPQYINWTSPVIGDWTGIVIDSAVTVQLLTNVTFPVQGGDVDDQPEYLSGTLVCNSYYLNLLGDTFVMGNGATLYTKMAGGVDSTIINGVADTFHNSTNFIFNGTSAQITGISMPTPIAAGGSVTINNPAGVSLSQSTIFYDSSALTLDTGSLSLGANYLGLSVAANLSGIFSSSTMIIANGVGQLIKQFTANDSFLYPIGDNLLNYTPVTLNVTGTTYDSTGTSYIGVTVTNAKHPANANTTDYLNRYWSISANNITGLSYTAAATYVTSDVVGTEANISAGEYAGLPWYKYGVTNVATHTLTSGAITDANADVSGISTAGPAVTSAPDTAVCIGSSAALYIVSAMRDTPFTYSWAPGATLSDSTSMTPTATPTVTTTYTVTMTDANGFTATAMTTVTVNQYPDVDSVTGGGPYCMGGAGSPVGLNTSDTGVNYQVFLGGSMIGSPVAGTDSALNLGMDTAMGYYTVVATGIHTGCAIDMSGAAFVSITPLAAPPSVSISSGMGDTLCGGTSTTFTSVYGSAGLTPVFQWIVNGAHVGADTSSYTYTPTDGNVVVLKITSSVMCATPDTAMDTIIMSVFPNEATSVHIVSSPGDTVCSGTGVVLTATPGFGGTAPSYRWVKNTLTVSTASTYSYTPANGDYIICLMNSNYRCRLDTGVVFSNVINMTVDSPIVPIVSITAHPGVDIGSGQPDTLVATITDGGISPNYQWYINNSAVPAATSGTFIRSTYNDKDSVTCKVTRTDACGLSSVNSVVIRVHPVGVQQLSAGTSIALTPNPNKGAFTVKGSLGSAVDQEVVMEITNMLGQVVYTNKVNAPNGQLNEQVAANNTLPSGIYILSLHSESGNSTFRFVVEQ